MASSSMPRDQLENIESMRKELQMVNMQILEEEARKEFLRKKGEKNAARIESLLQEQKLADQIDEAVTSKKRMLLGTEKQLKESVR